MFGMMAKDGCNCPVLVCDACGKHLDDADTAAVVFNNDMEEGAIVQLYHVHMDGLRYHNGCQDKIEKRIRDQGGMPGWQQMPSTIQQFVHNTGMTPKRLEEVGRLGIWGRL